MIYDSFLVDSLTFCGGINTEENEKSYNLVLIGF